MKEYNLEGFERGLFELGITLSEEQKTQFLQYYELLVEWNSFMNLTAITEFDQVITKHFLDSLSLVKVCDVEQAGRILDVGTGAGFPGIPLKIAFPEVEVVLLDSLNKRVKFLNEVIGQLGLSKITAVHGRAEDFARQKDYREQFDLVVSRAVANLSSLSEYCLPYVKVGGRFVSYKSGKLNEELAAAQKRFMCSAARQKSRFISSLREPRTSDRLSASRRGRQRRRSIREKREHRRRSRFSKE